MNTVNVANDFTRYPSGRNIASGPTSGQGFSKRFLIPAIQSKANTVIELDGTIGYGSSFLEEAFGGAIRATRISADEFFKLFDLRSSDPVILKEIREYVTDAANRIEP